MPLNPGVEDGKFGMNYDDKNLYIAFNVKDEELLYDENISWFLNDCIGIFVDPTLHQSSPFQEDDLQIGLVYQEDSSTPKFYFGSAKLFSINKVKKSNKIKKGGFLSKEISLLLYCYFP